jgi:hypothetical protein
MSDPLNARLNKILPKVISDEFLSGSGIGNEIAFRQLEVTAPRAVRYRAIVRARPLSCRRKRSSISE